MYADNGIEKKAYVTEFLKEILIAKNIALSDEQLDVLIEAAVKQMKIAEKE
ncbi:MAG: phage holin family protein, partial [Lachnospiraceae bacterium]|nr:phage holin family protein [Lachnospiraceae bacterium]